MRAILAASTALLLAACSGASASSSATAGEGASAPALSTVAATGDAAHPVVVELYQSQGCSSCPPAIKVVNRLADRADVIPLTFAVTYWDQLGWKDSFATPAFTARQWDYAHTAGRSQVATPQVIVNGRDAVLGSREGELNQAIARNVNKAGPEIDVDGNQVTVGAGKGPVQGGATVWVVRYDPRTIDVAINAGENGGRTIPHRNVVRDLTRLGQWQGKSASFTLPSAPAGLATAVLVQQGKGGPIVAARKI